MLDNNYINAKYFPGKSMYNKIELMRYNKLQTTQ